MKRVLAFLLAFAVCALSKAQTFSVDYGPDKGVCSFETMPSEFSCLTSDAIVSDAHSKLGEHSLQWTAYGSGASWRMDVPVRYLGENPNPDDTAVSTFVFWVYSAEAYDGSLHFSFLRDGKECCGFDYLLGFTGWRGAWVAFDRDMQGRPEEGMDAFEVRYKGKGKNVRLWFDGIIPAAFEDVRHHTADWQAPFVNASTTNFWLILNDYWNRQSDITPANALPDGQTEDFNLVESRFKTLASEGVQKWDIDRIRNYYDSWKISRNPDGTLHGKSVWFVRYSETYLDLGLNAKQDFKENGQLLQDLNDSMLAIALSWEQEKDPALKSEIGDIYLNLTRHLLDQGFQAGSGMGTLHHLGYSMRNFYNAPVIAKPLLREAGLLGAVQQAMEWFSGFGEVRTAPDHLGMDVDAFNTMLMGRFASVIMMEDTPEKAANFKALSRWVDNGYKYTEGLNPSFKRDGTVVHHRKCYPAYATGGFKGSVPAIWMLAGTDFAISRESHEIQKRALLEMRFWSNVKSFPLAMSGRHPDGKQGLVPVQYALLADAGSPDGRQDTDAELAEAYLRIKGNSSDKWTRKFRAAGFSPEPAPTGGRYYPYDCSLSWRRGDWLVTVAGHSRYIWAAEHYQGENMYGRYLAHGSLQILGQPQTYPDSFGSGFRQEGWDWTHIPGTTAAAIPLEQMKADIINADEFSGFEEMLLSDEWYAGGVVKGNEAAAYSFILHEHDKYNPSLRARKSWFIFDNRIICIGSDICNSMGEAHTTLYQNSISEDAAEAVTVLSSGANLVDSRGNCYYVPDGKVVKSEGLQHSYHEETCAKTSGHFEKAYIDHGENCKGASYLYALIPGPSTKADTDNLASSFEVLQRDSVAHAVRDLRTGMVAASVFSGTSLSGAIVSISPSVVIYRETDELLEISVANPDLALYGGKSDEVFDSNGKRVERSIYGRSWVNNPAAETEVRIELEGEWDLVSHICGAGLSCYTRLQPEMEYRGGRTYLTVHTKECRTETLVLTRR
ncbi:MAG: chondroitinase family polysaccharide lyase [Candidatus Cryptobacteroides sp.]